MSARHPLEKAGRPEREHRLRRVRKKARRDAKVDGYVVLLLLAVETRVAVEKRRLRVHGIVAEVAFPADETVERISHRVGAFIERIADVVPRRRHRHLNVLRRDRRQLAQRPTTIRFAVEKERIVKTRIGSRPQVTQKELGVFEGGRKLRRELMNAVQEEQEHGRMFLVGTYRSVAHSKRSLSHLEIAARIVDVSGGRREALRFLDVVILNRFHWARIRSLSLLRSETVVAVCRRQAALVVPSRFRVFAVGWATRKRKGRAGLRSDGQMGFLSISNQMSTPGIESDADITKLSSN